jgi:hypothetical protein
MRAALWLRFGTVARVMGLHRGETPELVDPGSLRDAAEIGWAVRTAAAHAPWTTTCLMQALAAAVLLRRRRIDATLYLGVANASGARDGLTAHAWLRCGELVLTGGGERGAFTTIGSFAATRHQRARPHRRRPPAGARA